jgi:peptide/nickel transport system substrate-binding protein
MNMRKISRLLPALCLVLALTACGRQTQAPPAPVSAEMSADESAPIETFAVGTTAEIVTANRSEYNFDVISGTLSQLAPVWQDENGEYQPMLCDYFTEDSKTWTLAVREGMKWDDGEPVTAEDIRFTLEYLDTQTDGGYADAFEDIRIIDGRTVELELPAANPRALSSLTTLRIMPKHIYEGVEDYTTVPNEQANIGCGPYKYVRFDADAGVVEFEAVEDYPDGKPAADKVVLRLFDNEDTMYMALKASEIDMIYQYSGGVSTTVIEDLRNAGNLTLQPVGNTANSAVLIFNNSVEPCSDMNIRKAVACAIDYEAFRENFGSSYAVPAAAGFIPKGTCGYADTPVLKRDLDRAREYLAAAGCTDSDGDGYVEYNAERLSIPVMLRDDKPAHARYAELLRNNLAEVGIEITLDVREVASFRELTEQQRAQTAVITGLTAFGMAKNQGLAALYLWGENSMGYGQVFDESYKALLDKADSAADLDEYKEAAAEIQEYYAETTPAIALFWDAHVQAYNSRYSGFAVDSTFGIMNVRTWMNLVSASNG